jgi:NAD(P)-dependent dehydrogenase (short-subunit alcohol dehydrogenase family)
MSKVALVTGGGKRLGRAICLSLAERGYDIAVHYNHSDKEARETSEAVKKSGRNSAIFKSDLSDWRASRDLVRSVVKTFPSCSVLVNSASVFEDVGFPDVTEEQFDRDFNVNFKSPFFLSQQFSKESRAGHIINLLDTRVSQIETALKDFTLMAAKALGPEIRVNAICPGPILPPPGKDESYLEKISGDTPLGVPGKPEYIVTALNYILDNPYVTGECLYVDGGQHLM